MSTYEYEHGEHHHDRDLNEVLEDVKHRAKYTLEELLEECVWDSKDIDDAKDCVEIICGVDKINHMDSTH